MVVQLKKSTRVLIQKCSIKEELYDTNNYIKSLINFVRHLKSKCLLERAFQQELSEQNYKTAQFIPECETNGSYSTV